MVIDEMEKYQEIFNVLKERLKKTMPSMDINFYMLGLFQIAEEKDMEFIDLSKDEIKFICPIGMKGTKELKSMSSNMREFVGLKMLVKYV
jgi:hypothetical protein